MTQMTSTLPTLGPTLVASPHFDDIVLSCAALVGRPEKITALHVFTGGPVPAVVGEWDVQSGFANSDEALIARRFEERSAFAGTPHDALDLELLDAQYVGEQSDQTRKTITEAADAWFDDVGTPCTIVLPVGAGCERGEAVPLARLKRLLTRNHLYWKHPDHLAARDACLEAALRRAGVEVILYEEFPYLTTVRGDAAAAEVARRFGPGARAELVEVAIDRDEKARRLRAYKSQLPLLIPRWALQGDRLRRYLPRTERYWRIVRE